MSLSAVVLVEPPIESCVGVCGELRGLSHRGLISVPALKRFKFTTRLVAKMRGSSRRSGQHGSSQLQRNSGDMAGILMIAVHTGGVVTERYYPAGAVGQARGVAKSELTPLVLFPMPVTLFKSPLTPLAVLMSPVLLLKSSCIVR